MDRRTFNKLIAGVFATPTAFLLGKPQKTITMGIDVAKGESKTVLGYDFGSRWWVASCGSRGFVTIAGCKDGQLYNFKEKMLYKVKNQMVVPMQKFKEHPFLFGFHDKTSIPIFRMQIENGIDKGDAMEYVFLPEGRPVLS